MSFLRKRPPLGCITETYDERTEQAQKDLLVIFEYLAQRTSGLGATDEDITQAAHICSLPYRSLGEPQRVEVWRLLNRLCRFIAPATVEGLRASQYEHTGLSGWPTLFVGVIGTFIVAMLLQTYALFGSQTLDQLKQLNTEAQGIFDQINVLEQHKPELYKFGLTLDKRREEPKTPAEPETHKIEWDKATPEYSQLRARLDAINRAKQDVFRNIYQWNAIWGVPIAFYYGRPPGDYWGFECNPSEEETCKHWTAILDKRWTADPALGQSASNLDLKKKQQEVWKHAPFGNIQIRYGSEALARSNLEALRGLVLPVLYGALGAWVWLLRDRYRQVLDRRLRSLVWGEYLQRVLLGAVFGATLGYLNLPSFLPTPLADISMIGLAFIIGYNVEIVFWQFDRMLKFLRVKERE